MLKFTNHLSPIMSVFRPRNSPITSAYGVRNYLNHFDDFWAQKLTLWTEDTFWLSHKNFVSFWTQKLLKWVNIISGPRN